MVDIPGEVASITFKEGTRTLSNLFKSMVYLTLTALKANHKGGLRAKTSHPHDVH